MDRGGWEEGMIGWSALFSFSLYLAGRPCFFALGSNGWHTDGRTDGRRKDRRRHKHRHLSFSSLLTLSVGLSHPDSYFGSSESTRLPSSPEHSRCLPVCALTDCSPLFPTFVPLWRPFLSPSRNHNLHSPLRNCHW